MRLSTGASLLLLTLLAGLLIASSHSTVCAEESHGVISIAFDDEYQSQYDYAYPIMQNYGVVGTFYVCTNNIAKSGYMSAEQLQEIHNSGNEIASHSHTHTSFTWLTPEEIDYECLHSKQILENHGFAVTNFAYPNGVTNDNVDSIVSEYYRTGRTAYVSPYLMNLPTSQFRIAGFSAETADYTAITLLKQMVDQVYQTNGWTIIFFHQIKPHTYTELYTTSTEDFENFLNYTISKGVRTLTVNQALDSLSLATTANFGTVDPASGLYALGTQLDIRADAPSATDGERYVWLGWTGSGAGSYTGSENPATITLIGPVTQTAVWRHEYRLLVSSATGDNLTHVNEYWYEAGSTVNVDAVSPTPESGERFIWSGWTGTGLGSYSGSNMGASVTMNGPIVQVGKWAPQYYVTVSSIFGVAEGSGWYNSGETIHATIDMSIANASSNTRYLFDGWSEDAKGSGMTSDAMIVNRPLTAVASWNEQNLIVFDQTGLPNNYDVNAMVNFTTRDLPFSIWVNKGEDLQFMFPKEFSDGFARSYILVYPQNQSLTSIISPVTLTAQYSLQYSAEFVAAILLPLVLVFFLTSILLLRKRKST